MTLDEATIQVLSEGVYTSSGFTCDWSVDVLGQTGEQSVKGSPTTIWLGAESRAMPAGAPEAVSAQSLCPTSPVFWDSFGRLPDGGEAAVKNEIASRRIDVTDQVDGLPGMQFRQLPGVTIEKAQIWVADPGDWVSAIEMVLSVGPDAATSMWGIPFDPEADPTEMTYTVAVLRPDDFDLEVSLPASVDFGIGFREVSVSGDPLPPYEAGSLDTAIQMTAPSLSGTDWNSVPTTIEADGRSKIIVLLAHWCPHCQNEVPEIVEWVGQGNLPDTVDMYAVTVMTDHTRGNWPPQDWLLSEEWSLPVIMDDAGSSALLAYGINSVPSFLVLDGDNATLVRVSGGIGASGLDTLVRIALGE
jgi:thiol-disulfide isomerase/thioredoxin